MNNKIFFISTLMLVCLFFIELSASDTVLNIGDAVPGFVANNQDGELWQSDNFIGKKNVVVYFYPGALTGGCTKQACSYRDNKSKFDDFDVEVIGISADPVKNLKIFGNMYNLNFTLLSDVSGNIAEIFGVPTGGGASITREVEGKEMDLIRPSSISRWTFIIDKSGKIVYKDTEVTAKEDSDKVIEFLNKK